MQELTLSYSRTNKYVDILSKQGLISYNRFNHGYDITQKGRKVLMLNQQLARYIYPVEAMIKKYSRYIKDPCDVDGTESCLVGERLYSSRVAHEVHKETGICTL